MIISATILVALFFGCLLSTEQVRGNESSEDGSVDRVFHLFKEWNRFESAMREETITPLQAKTTFTSLYARIKEYGKDFSFQDDDEWAFPVVGSTVNDVYRNDFQPDSYYGSSKVRGYIYFDPLHHGGHPAYDIFTQDKDQNSLDDRTGKSILILAPVDMIILTAYQEWTPDSRMRGGQYVWGIDTSKDTLYYFAHLDKIIVEPGQFVTKGSVIASLGRSGKNAYPSRSPTHLHLMLMKVEGTNVQPFNFYTKLSNAKTVKTP